MMTQKYLMRVAGQGATLKSCRNIELLPAWRSKVRPRSFPRRLAWPRSWRGAFLIRCPRIMFEDAGFDLRYISYIHFWLFPIAIASPLSSKLMSSRNSSTGQAQPASVINSALALVFGSERLLPRRTRLSYGLPLIAVAKKV